MDKLQGPFREHVKLCLQLILQAHLHQIDAGLSHQKVVELCDLICEHNRFETHAARLEMLQVKAAQLLPTLN